MVKYHAIVKKGDIKSWKNHHIKNKQSNKGEKVLLYDNKFMKHPSIDALVRAIHCCGIKDL